MTKTPRIKIPDSVRDYVRTYALTKRLKCAWFSFGSFRYNFLWTLDKILSDL